MSNIFKTAEITYIDDCRELNYTECLGLILNGILFNKFNIKDGYSINYRYFKAGLIKGNINRYTFSCNPEQNSNIIRLYDNDNNYELYIIPRYNYIRIVIKYNNNEIAYLNYSIEELEDMLL